MIGFQSVRSMLQTNYDRRPLSGGAVKRVLLFVSGFIAVSTPLVATATEVKIRCTMIRSNVTTTNPILDKRLNSQQDITNRYYIIDDTNKIVWSFVNGEKRPLCNPNEQCAVQYSKSTITRQNITENTTSNFTLDRVAGTISENIAMMDNSGQTVAFMTFGGDCQTDAERKPKF